jgi:urease accessory protein UreH
MKKAQLNDIAETAKFYMNEITYLTSTHENEKMQGRKFTSKLCILAETLEIHDYRQSFIDLCWSAVTCGLTKFK